MGSMSNSAEKHTRYFQIGAVRTSLETPVRRIANEYASLYREFQIDGPHTDAVRVTVRAKCICPWHRRRYNVTANGRLQFEPARGEGILPYIEWASNWEVPRQLTDYLHIHAAAMELDGEGVIFPGISGSGKSTLAAALLTKGWRYLSDEFAMINRTSLRLHAYPRALSIKERAISVIESLGLKMHRRRRYKTCSKGSIGFIGPSEMGIGAIGDTCRIGHVVFPKYSPGARPELIPISRAHAAFALHKVCFNLLALREVGTDILAAIVRGAKCYRLVSGEINATCDLLERAVRGRQALRVMSA